MTEVAPRVYHGSDTPGVARFDHGEAGGLFWFTPERRVAEKYAATKGLGLNASDPDQYFELERLLKKDPAALNPYVTEASLDIKRPLDLVGPKPEPGVSGRAAPPQGYAVLADLDPDFGSAYTDINGREQARRIINQAREIAHEGGSDLYFWENTKREKWNNAWANIIVPQLEQRGYDGLVMQDAADTGLSYAAFRPEQVRHALAPQSAPGPDQWIGDLPLERELELTDNLREVVEQEIMGGDASHALIAIRDELISAKNPSDVHARSIHIKKALEDIEEEMASQYGSVDELTDIMDDLKASIAMMEDNQFTHLAKKFEQGPAHAARRQVMEYAMDPEYSRRLVDKLVSSGVNPIEAMTMAKRSIMQSTSAETPLHMVTGKAGRDQDVRGTYGYYVSPYWSKSAGEPAGAHIGSWAPDPYKTSVHELIHALHAPNPTASVDFEDLAWLGPGDSPMVHVPKGTNRPLAVGYLGANVSPIANKFRDELHSALDFMPPMSSATTPGPGGKQIPYARLEIDDRWIEDLVRGVTQEVGNIPGLDLSDDRQYRGIIQYLAGPKGISYVSNPDEMLVSMTQMKMDMAKRGFIATPHQKIDRALLDEYLETPYWELPGDVRRFRPLVTERKRDDFVEAFNKVPVVALASGAGLAASRE